MEFFSTRTGIKKKRDIFQREDWDVKTKNLVWSLYQTTFLDEPTIDIYGKIRKGFSTTISSFLNLFWVQYLNQPNDTFTTKWVTIYKHIRDYFYSCKWYELYDILEFTIQNYSNANLVEKFKIEVNKLFEREMVSYRIIENTFLGITSDTEITEIEQALSAKNTSVQEHLNRSLELLSDRENPDYRNSIKESISAVEAIAKKISNNDKATLGDAIKNIEKQIGLHGAFKEALLKLYGYTSDQGGIRHSLLDESKIGFEDAKFMLVSCSAFINYLIEKTNQKI
ncbi:AbiJ-NTD4 domain-containing protein [Leptospira terpstrae]|uniref:HEPN AbiJ-N-terminal domain-containing protein n=1 Tax=Leptospira terpstrae serovar Hualin str. LT 11-33 = ATCC 700639 TaxID=1257025 RepID=N1VTI7_9LEPT|nr:hypothetical protein [Leptospira terpstrae]EMY60287.1 hypothetical protein LEP1GSC203_0746 [Leptospira terpstrae serovar Hualin str. LT 11-33 = ATCC 700639]